jgi:homoisocitrate dehydrogenase
MQQGGLAVELCVIEGDGIGREVIPAAVQVLQGVIPNVTIHQAEAGWECFKKCGVSLPDETVELARSCKAVLFGACSSPHYPVEGYFSPIVRLRRVLATYGNLRPTSYLPVPTARMGVDLLVVRENTEDLYIGDERVEDEGNTTTATKRITRVATERIAHMAYQLARLTHHKRVTVVHKGNVLPHTDGLFRRVAFEVAEQYPDIETDELLVDTAAYWMVKEPTRFEVILTPNLYGDILSDMAAAWGGGLGLAPACNLGDDVAIAEPVHGSAPDIAGKGIANPTAAILSAALLVRYHWQMPEVADRIEQAVHATLKEGDHTTDIHAEGAISTAEFTEHVISHL